MSSDVMQGTVVSFGKETKYRKADGKPFTINWMKLDNGEAINCGFKVPQGIEVGDDVTVEYTVAYGEKKMKKVSSGTTQATASVPRTSGGGNYKGGSSGGGKPFPIPPTHGDRAIVRQNSLTNAVKAVGDYCEVIVGGMPEELTEYTDMILQIARKFEEYSTGDIERRMAEEGVDAETAMKKFLGK